MRRRRRPGLGDITDVAGTFPGTTDSSSITGASSGPFVGCPGSPGCPGSDSTITEVGGSFPSPGSSQLFTLPGTYTPGTAPGPVATVPNLNSPVSSQPAACASTIVQGVCNIVVFGAGLAFLFMGMLSLGGRRR